MVRIAQSERRRGAVLLTDPSVRDGASSAGQFYRDADRLLYDSRLQRVSVLWGKSTPSPFPD